MMTPEHERHMEQQIERFSRQARVKYKGGQQEHGGCLWAFSKLSLVREAKQEVIDQWFFLDELERQLLAEESDAGSLDPQMPNLSSGSD